MNSDAKVFEIHDKYTDVFKRVLNHIDMDCAFEGYGYLFMVFRHLIRSSFSDKGTALRELATQYPQLVTELAMSSMESINERFEGSCEVRCQLAKGRTECKNGSYLNIVKDWYIDDRFIDGSTSDFEMRNEAVKQAYNFLFTRRIKDIPFDMVKKMVAEVVKCVGTFEDPRVETSYVPTEEERGDFFRLVYRALFGDMHDRGDRDKIGDIYTFVDSLATYAFAKNYFTERLKPELPEGYNFPPLDRVVVEKGASENYSGYIDIVNDALEHGVITQDFIAKFNSFGEYAYKIYTSDSIASKVSAGSPEVTEADEQRVIDDWQGIKLNFTEYTDSDLKVQMLTLRNIARNPETASEFNDAKRLCMFMRSCSNSAFDHYIPEIERLIAEEEEASC